MFYLNIQHLDNMARANFCAFSAANAFFGVDRCVEVFNFDRAGFAVFHTLHTADTAHGADFHRGRTLIAVGAKHFRLLFGGVQLD